MWYYHITEPHCKISPVYKRALCLVLYYILRALAEAFYHVYEACKINKYCIFSCSLTVHCLKHIPVGVL